MPPPGPVPPFSLDEVAHAFAPMAVTELLGCGSFKAAYLASDNGATLVLKVLTEALATDLDEVDSSDLPTRFAREMSGMMTISSPHLVQVLRKPAIVTINAQSHVWYAEPFYSNGTLQDRIAAGEAGWDLSRSVTAAMLEAIRAMWTTHKIVHRDIKPGNIVFDNDMKPVLLDLGIAYFPDLTDLTDAHAPSPRTNRYAAPEQFEMRRNVTIDFRTDLFMVGMVAFEALTGRHPFWEPGIDSGLYFTRLRTFNRTTAEPLNCPDEFKDLLTKLLAERPGRRPRSIASAQDAMDAIA